MTTTRAVSTQYGVQLTSARVGRTRGAFSWRTSSGATVCTEVTLCRF